ncbi:3'(2'),5'-bisphosphate nucleotidase CysQ [Desulfocurvibacter africanus]|uniref:3'(2'),5'-bisphosphate nucleotidase CysQ n=1 Tax=Desulfocurvibacter africanus TaxID=873 RepID=UPI002FDB9682
MAEIALDSLKAAFIEAAQAAGREILRVYGTQFGVERKADDSPLTEADKAAHAAIKAVLTERFPDIPILSEEGRHLPYNKRKHWPRMFVVDPLDGTKEFVKRNGQFTVNIALVEHQRPVLGIIGVPVQGLLYWGGPDIGAFRVEDGRETPISTRKPDPGQGHVVLESVSHKSPDMDAYLATLHVRQRVEVGSALKFCVLAEGKADLYPRFNLTYEWDTAAGHAIVLGAGGSFTGLDGGPFLYNKENLKNPEFVAKG